MTKPINNKGKIMSLKHIQSKSAGINMLKAPTLKALRLRSSNFEGMGIGKTSFKLEENRKSKIIQVKENRKK